MGKIRISSIDIFRGMTMVLMVIVNNPGDWGHIYHPFKHADWNGCTPTDWVFPFFVFAMGMAVPFSRSKGKGLSGEYMEGILGRSLRIINLGLMLNFFSHIQIGNLEGIPLMLIRLAIAIFIGWLMLAKFNSKTKLYTSLAVFFGFMILAYSGIEAYSTVRLPGVLQRLGIIYFIGAIIYQSFNFRGQIIWVLGILFGYWAAMMLIPVPGVGVGNLEVGTNFAAYVDQILLKGHMWKEDWDPEGLLSTIPAIASFLIGIWMGQFMKEAKTPVYHFTLAGLVLLTMGGIWHIWFPINKSMWTSSYSIYTSGMAIFFMSILIFLFDGKKQNSFSNYFIMWGLNPMIVFFGSGLLPRALNMIKLGEAENQIGMLGYFNKMILAPQFSEPKNASMTYALLNVLFWTLVLVYLHRKKIMIKV